MSELYSQLPMFPAEPTAGTGQLRLMPPLIEEQVLLNADADGWIGKSETRRKVLIGVCRGLSNAQIANQHGISVPRVKDCIEVLLERAQAENRVILAQRAVLSPEQVAIGKLRAIV